MKNRIYNLLGSLAVALLFTTCSTGANENSDQIRPNILFVISDDQSWLHAGAYGDPQIKTPAFDRIASEGVLFNNSFCTSPSCTPSRSSVLTGQDIWRMKEAGLLFGSIPPELPLVSHMLADAGYHVGYTGKGWAPGNWSYLGLEREPLIQAYNEKLEQNIAEGIDKRDYTSNFEDFLEAKPDDTPFFFWFGATEPHREYPFNAGIEEANLDPGLIQVPSFWPDDPLIRSDILDYYYEIMWYDTHLAGMLAKLEERGELENTLIVATSDNGMPFPRAKVNVYDWGTRMPLAIRWGNEVPQGRALDDMVSHIDFAPTFLDAAGLAIPEEMTGKSLLPILKTDKDGQVDAARDRVFTALERHTWCRPEGATYPIRSLRTKDFLYIRNFQPDRWPTGGPEYISSNKTFHGDVDACPTKTFMLLYEEEYPTEFELAFGKRPSEELYLVEEDFSQVNNLADDPAYVNVKDSLSAMLITHLEATGDPRIKGEDPWQEQVYHQETNFGSTYNRLLPQYEIDRAKLRPSHHPKWKVEKK